MLITNLISRYMKLCKAAFSVSIQNSPSFVDTALLLPLHKKDVCTE